LHVVEQALGERNADIARDEHFLEVVPIDLVAFELAENLFEQSGHGGAER